MKRDEDGRAWYVAETLPRAEFLSQRQLEQQHFSSFCPRYRKTRRHARQVEEVLVPVFPGYVFVCFDLKHDQWSSINGTRGVKRLVAFSASTPQPMPRAAMQALFTRCTGEVINNLLPALKPSQRVQIVKGPFANMLATVEQLDDRGRVRLLLNLLGGRAPLEMDVSAVGPV